MRTKKVTPERLQERIDEYFDAISYEVPITEQVDVGQRNGKSVLEPQPVFTRSGEPARRLCWSRPPTIGELCVYLGVTRSQWAQWAADAAFAPVIERANLRVEAYLVARLEEKNYGGVKFNLMQNFGWKDQPDEEPSAPPMSMDEKHALLQELLGEV